jgi:peptide deformylase
MLNIIKYPNKILRRKSRAVININDPRIQTLINELAETMEKADGIGIAAPQIGENLNIIAVRVDYQSLVFINPRVVWKNWLKRHIFEEGCLSFPNIFGLVKRPQTVWLIYQDQSGKYKSFKATGLIASVFQHEIEHLRGRLFIDKIFKYTKNEEIIKKLIAKARNDER